MLLIRRLIFLLLISCAAIAAHCFSAAPQSYWFILIILPLSLVEQGDTFFRRVSIIVITGMATAMIVFLAGVFSTHVVLLAIALALLTMCCVYATGTLPQYYLPIIIINISAILSGTLSVPVMEYSDRMGYVLLGTVVVAFLQIMYLPGFTRNELRLWLEKSLLNLELINKDIFSCFLQPEYIDNIYLFERRIHTQKNKLMQSLNQSRQIVMDTSVKMANADREALMQWLTTLEYIYTIVLDCAQLRLRVSDHTVFGLCGNEIDAISKEAILIVRAAMNVLTGRAHAIDAIAMPVRIKHLDENYHNVLRITAHEPLVFLLFISSLKTLNDELISLYNNTNMVNDSLGRI